VRVALLLIAIVAIIYGLTELISLYREARQRDHLGHELDDNGYELNPHEWRVRQAMIEREAQNRENL
jgi:hypothetical protein